MTSNIRDLSLVSCESQFGEMLEHCEITGRDDTAFGLEPGVAIAMQILAKVRESCGSVYVIGNGGSASVASHAVVDFVNVAKLRAFTLHEPSLLTCMSNDYGYENAYARILAQVAKSEDVLIAISSSGNSMSIHNAIAQMEGMGGRVITLSGFSHDNPLRLLGDVNVWLNSSNYGLVEIGHQFILHNMSDRFGAGYMEQSSS